MTAMALTMPIGMVVSRVLLGALFSGLFTPVGLFFKLIGRDALARRYAPEQASYWEPSRAPPTYAATCVSPNLWRSR